MNRERAAVLAFSLLVILWPATGQAQELTVERIGSLPSLSGTAPSNPVWSPDSTKLAFLWNDQGWPLRDVWLVSAEGDTPRQITDIIGTAENDAERKRPGVSEVLWSADGNALFYTYQGRLWRIPAAGGEPAGLVDVDGCYAISVSPNGKLLSFLSGGDLWLWHLDTNELVQATQVGKPAIGTIPGALFSRLDVELSSPRWSPDSRFVALHFDDRRRLRKELIPNYLGLETHIRSIRRDYPGQNDHVRAVAIYSVDKGRLRMLDLPDPTYRSINGFSWSPDASSLLVDQSSEDAVDRWLYIANPGAGPGSGSYRELWHDRREKQVSSFWASTWRSDGRAILFTSDRNDRSRLYSLALDGRSPKQLTEGDWSVTGESASSRLAIAPGPQEVFFVATKKNPYERQVYRMRESGGAVSQVTTLPGTHSPFLSPDGTKLATIRSSDTSPAELYIIPIAADATERRVTHSPPEEFETYRWAEPHYVTFKSQIDGVKLHGRLLEPPGLDPSKKYPVIIGPVYPNTVRNRWGDREESRGLFTLVQQYLALEGKYIGFHVDVRGSVGHGREFRERLMADVGVIDIEDLASGVEYLKTLPYVDPERIGIWGSSYGGLMTLLSLFKKPGVYRAGVAGAPVSDFRHVTPGVAALVRRPETHPEAHRRGSAIHYGEDLEDPLMILHGMQDSIVLFKDSVVLSEKLIRLGKDFELVLIPNATHYWSREDPAAVFALRRLVSHFDRHLGRGPR